MGWLRRKQDESLDPQVLLAKAQAEAPIADGSQREVTVTGIEAFRKTMDVTEPGQKVGLLLRDVGRDDIGRGDELLG